MLYKRYSIVLIIYFFASFIVAQAKELVPSLRKAERLYEKGFYEKAAKKADEYIAYFPNDVQARIIAGMSYYHMGSYVESIDNFVIAEQKQPKNPIVVRYIKMLRELEYRSEPFVLDPEIKAKVDPLQTAEFYKRNFWSPKPTELSPKIEKNPFSADNLEPHLMTIPNEGRNVKLITVLPPEIPAKMLTGEETMLGMAKRALKEGQYLKSYLFYSQLNASKNKVGEYLLGKAESAYGLRRYTQVLELLSPCFATSEVNMWPVEIRDRAEILIASARLKVYNK